jgi:hypothetical protein
MGILGSCLVSLFLLVLWIIAGLVGLVVLIWLLKTIWRAV